MAEEYAQPKTIGGQTDGTVIAIEENADSVQKNGVALTGQIAKLHPADAIEQVMSKSPGRGLCVIWPSVQKEKLTRKPSAAERSVLIYIQ